MRVRGRLRRAGHAQAWQPFTQYQDPNRPHNQYFQSLIRNIPSISRGRLVEMFHGEFVYEGRTGEAGLAAIGRRMAGQRRIDGRHIEA
ncbi:hypothetical protein [Bradyrhizobium sp. SBR1B]|uniref:hypothetical protein n=1 Tax=Bradyrhizobium sp. SBR1B TaxID=2663836 RepID=UPI0016067CD6|nr:hypothetical protein [Bradyrhizobium sp. SBR1B]MBB4376344.1 hypothetical protein [Bradyrhizobium sp. SBR1B]